MGCVATFGPHKGYVSGWEFLLQFMMTNRFRSTIINSQDAPSAAHYTSRGPLPSYPGVLKPDIVAPGSRVLPSFVPHRSATKIGTRCVLTL
ncbi:Peptidase S8/S53 domain superfamily [Sesbania bispinosa]|nr:Peptidase S8/S53 domain superfamily [Sesbania bispinosa]